MLIGSGDDVYYVLHVISTKHWIYLRLNVII